MQGAMAPFALCICIFAVSEGSVSLKNLEGLCIAEGAMGDCRVTDVKDFSAKKPIAAPCCDEEADLVCVPFHPSLTGKCMAKAKNPFENFLKKNMDQDGRHILCTATFLAYDSSRIGDGKCSKQEAEIFVVNSSPKSLPVFNAASMKKEEIVASIM
jgi:hypothetical protein